MTCQSSHWKGSAGSWFPCVRALCASSDRILDAAVEIGLCRVDVGIGRTSQHRRFVCITHVGNHCNKCSVGHIHGECMLLIMGYSYGIQSICGVVKIHDDSNIIMYLQVFLSISSFFLFSCVCSPSRVSFLNALRCVSFLI